MKVTLSILGNKMRVAFCLSGAPRFRYRGLFRQLETIQGYDQADFFIRTWKSDEYGNTPEEFVSYLRKEGIPDNVNFPVVEVLDDKPEYYPPHIPLNLAHWAPNFLILWWGILQSNNLRLKYQAETDTKYDIVFRMRTDMVPGRLWQNDKPVLDLREYVERAQTTLFNAQNFADNFIFCGPELYNKFASYWDHLQVLSKNWTFIHPEESLEQYLKDMKIPYELLPFEVYPTHDRDEYKVRPH